MKLFRKRFNQNGEEIYFFFLRWINTYRSNPLSCDKRHNDFSSFWILCRTPCHRNYRRHPHYWPNLLLPHYSHLLLLLDLLCSPSYKKMQIDHFSNTRNNKSHGTCRIKNHKILIRSLSKFKVLKYIFFIFQTATCTNLMPCTILQKIIFSFFQGSMFRFITLKLESKSEKF